MPADRRKFPDPFDEIPANVDSSVGTVCDDMPRGGLQGGRGAEPKNLVSIPPLRRVIPPQYRRNHTRKN